MTINQIITGQVGGLFYEETEVTRYIVLAASARGFEVPDPNTHLSDLHFQNVDAPGLLHGSLPVILFRTRHTKLPGFSVRLNSTRLTNHIFKDDNIHSWHEIIPGNVLKPQDNELIFAVSGEGSVNFSDVVIFYKSNELTVKKPLVATPG